MSVFINVLTIGGDGGFVKSRPPFAASFTEGRRIAIIKALFGSWIRPGAGRDPRGAEVAELADA